MFTSQSRPARNPPGIHGASSDRPHPLVGRAAVFAIVAAMLAIVWAKVEVLGTRDIERTLTEEEATLAQVCADRLEAVAFNRWATGFSQ
ncbi:MAG: hypothetical protein JSS40_02450 [Proteobacteria bacterium]|nr:hypothetical protein [Pseudomonadota bacterium]